MQYLSLFVKIFMPNTAKKYSEANELEQVKRRAKVEQEKIYLLSF